MIWRNFFSVRVHFCNFYSVEKLKTKIHQYRIYVKSTFGKTEPLKIVIFAILDALNFDLVQFLQYKFKSLWFHVIFPISYLDLSCEALPVFLPIDLLNWFFATFSRGFLRTFLHACKPFWWLKFCHFLGGFQWRRSDFWRRFSPKHFTWIWRLFSNIFRTSTYTAAYRIPTQAVKYSCLLIFHCLESPSFENLGVMMFISLEWRRYLATFSGIFSSKHFTIGSVSLSPMHSRNLFTFLQTNLFSSRQMRIKVVCFDLRKVTLHSRKTPKSFIFCQGRNFWRPISALPSIAIKIPRNCKYCV